MVAVTGAVVVAVVAAVVVVVVVVVATSLVRLAKFGNSVLALKTPHSLRSTMQRETLP